MKSIKHPSQRLLNASWMLFWGALSVCFLITLPGFSQSDTVNYIAIAKTMMATHNYLVPYLHGQLYTDKPPLLFWLFIAGWRVFGINNWWPQLISILFATASILVTKKLAKQLWPQDEMIAILSPFILIGFIYWAWFSKQIRVDPLLTLAVLAAISALLSAAKGRLSAWWIYLLAVGFGGLCKGPVELIFILIPGILLPLWQKAIQVSRKKWFIWLALTTLVGVALTLVWAIPAAIQGGKHFADSIFYGQIAHRAHYHEDHFYFYLIRLPFWLLPWTLFPPFWMGLGKMRIKQNLGLKLCVTVLIIDLIVFSFFGQKLPHYIYPLMPFAALIMAWAINAVTGVARWQQWPIALIVFIFAVVLFIAPYVMPYINLKTQIRAYFIDSIHITWPILVLFLSLLLCCYRPNTRLKQLALIVLSVCIIDIFMNVTLLTPYQRHMHRQPFLDQIKHLDQQNKSVAVFGEVTDTKFKQYLRAQPHAQLTAKTVKTWLRQHPHGWVVTTKNCLVLALKGQIAPVTWYYEDRYKIMSLWPARTLSSLADKTLLCEDGRTETLKAPIDKINTQKINYPG